MSNLNFPIKERLTWLLYTSHRISTPSESWPQLMLACRAASSCCCLTIAQLVHRHFDLSQTTQEVLQYRTSDQRLIWNTYLQHAVQAAAHETGQRKGPVLLHKAAVDARGPDVSSEVGCLAWGEWRALSSVIHCLISRFNFNCEDSRCWRKYMCSPFAAIHKDILQFYIKGLCIPITLSSPIPYHLH